MKSKALLATAAVLCFMSDAPAQETTRSDPLTRTTPAWFDEAKLGIFIHWNAAAIPAFAPVTPIEALRAEISPDPLARARKSPWAEDYAKNMLVPGSATARYHATHYGKTPYETFVAQFRDEMIPGWDPVSWADLFARAGARYVVLTARLDDGFLLWPSAHPNPYQDGWQSKRDVVGELAAALRARGLRSGLYYRGGIDWTFGRIPMDTAEPLPADMWRTSNLGRDVDPGKVVKQRAYVNAHWRELIERYRPDVLWNDGGETLRNLFYPGAPPPVAGVEGEFDTAFREYLEELFRFYFERVPEGVINNRFDGFWQGSGALYTDFVTPEYQIDPPEGWDGKWEVCRGIGTSFTYNRQEDDKSYLSSTELIHLFVDIVARGGNLLINVGPTATGEIAWPQAQRLLELGWWLRTNGDSIYGTRPWVRTRGITGEGLEVRYTASKDAVNAILLGAPKSPVVELDLRLDEGVEVALSGWSGRLRWTETPAGVRIELPEQPDARPALSLRFSPGTGVHPSW